MLELGTRISLTLILSQFRSNVTNRPLACVLSTSPKIDQSRILAHLLMMDKSWIHAGYKGPLSCVTRVDGNGVVGIAVIEKLRTETMTASSEK